MTSKQSANIDREHFDALRNVARRLTAASGERLLIDETIDVMVDVVGAERGLFAKYDRGKDGFDIVAARDASRENIDDLSKFSSGLLRTALETRAPKLYHDVAADPNASQFKSLLIQNINSALAAPIISKGVVWGVILVDSRGDRKGFVSENLAVVEFIADLVSLALDKIEGIERMRNENLALRSEIAAVRPLPDIVGESKAMRRLSATIRKVAPTDATALLLGESGVGKDLVARAIHRISPRKEGPFLAQFCGAIPDSLLESELFGFKKGAFTGAGADKKGLFEVADEGVFFLDEIAEISPALQAKLLRVLQNGEIIPLGDSTPKKVNVRIIAATNKDLKTLARQGEFREDLFYRLNVFPIQIPPLRERHGDVPLLTKHFVDRYAERPTTIEARTLKLLEDYQWPGNVRQLQNVVRRALILCEGDRLLPEHIVIEGAQDEESFAGTLAEFEERLLRKRLEMYEGNRTQTAKSLGVSVRWVQLKIKELNIEE
ncbi:MAG: GAF domain-containing protein [Ignavibacteriales bacterium]|nr:GAF domain-containing protein [Ignavibacteriales bacterium]